MLCSGTSFKRLGKNKQTQNNKHKQQKTLEKNKQTKNTGPTTRPRINISQVLAGWAVFVFLCFVSKAFLFFGFYLNLFVYTCKSLKSLGKNNKHKIKTNKTKHIWHPPAHQPTANKYLSGSGWMSCMLLLLCFVLEGFLLFCVFTRVASLMHATT